MKLGDKLIVRVAGQRLEGVIELLSRNGKSLAVGCQHGVPPPLALNRKTGLVQLLLLKLDDGTWIEIMGNREVTIEEVRA